VAAAEALSVSTSLDWPAFISTLERAWGVHAAKLTDVLPFALAVLTEEGQVVAPRHPVPQRLLEPLPPSLLRLPLRSLPMGRAYRDLETAEIATLGGLLLATMENRLPQGRSAEATTTLLSAVATSLTEAGELDQQRLATALDLPLLPGAPVSSPTAFLEAFNAAMTEATKHGRMPGRAPRIWAMRTARPAGVRPTLDQTGVALQTIGPIIKRDETTLLTLLNAQLVEGDRSRAGVIWRDDFVARVSEAAVEWRGSGGDFDAFVSRLADRWELDAASLRRKAAGLWAVLSLYPAGRRRRAERPSTDRVTSTAVRPPEVQGLIVLRGFRRVH
jgi:hypothetical protein